MKNFAPCFPYPVVGTGEDDGNCKIYPRLLCLEGCMGSGTSSSNDTQVPFRLKFLWGTREHSFKIGCRLLVTPEKVSGLTNGTILDVHWGMRIVGVNLGPFDGSCGALAFLQSKFKVLGRLCHWGTNVKAPTCVLCLSFIFWNGKSTFYLCDSYSTFITTFLRYNPQF